MTALAHARQRAALAARLRREFTGAWARVDPGSIWASWQQQIPQLLTLLAGAQRAAASTADAFITSEVGQGQYRVRPETFAYVASDGRPLAGLLLQPPVAALRAIGSGARLPDAMNMASFSAGLLAHTQVADAGRTADLTAMTANPAVRSWTRMLVGSTCARCLLLAGQRYTWKADFKRHPKCDCIAVPSAEAPSADAAVNPDQAFREMDTAEQNRVFGRAGAQAIREGADMAQVVNARKKGSMYRADGRLYTRQGGPGATRLMPETIFKEANGNRQEAIRLLSLHGYIY